MAVGIFRVSKPRKTYEVTRPTPGIRGREAVLLSAASSAASRTSLGERDVVSRQDRGEIHGVDGK